ncbi:hypothetical protein PPTG_24046 [Phytophthora nicotianae INRA-310]|uniref:Uncharacterized protein n=1 Tax=Phytophthora nicotianae (strain INRA-310) TaxID=761204 RepID=W2PL79_PHYN3|nr:hypothetical protein PPTG_24046 [Phytophthora nicotianae INRA-310]ETN01627.1 hypothetical protein PPTG_24046 [Phytophthora nicotianae INRA-310]
MVATLGEIKQLFESYFLAAEAWNGFLLGKMWIVEQWNRPRTKSRCIFCGIHLYIRLFHLHIFMIVNASVLVSDVLNILVFTGSRFNIHVIIIRNSIK